MDDSSPNILEKYLYISEIAEEMLSLAKNYYNEALEIVSDYDNVLDTYVRHIESFRNKCNLVKVNVEAYRISQFIRKVTSQKIEQARDLAEAISRAEDYVSRLQSNNGSWYEISNKQGLSNVWSTGFISLNLNNAFGPFRSAVNFLINNKQGGLWGYNTDWIYDYDSSTCALLTLNKAGIDISSYLDFWFEGQSSNGGFSTYKGNKEILIKLLGFRDDKAIKGWSDDHVCVSALAYFFLSSITNVELKYKYYKNLELLKRYLFKKE